MTHPVNEFFERQFAKEFTMLMTVLKAKTRINIQDIPVPFETPELTQKVIIRGIEDKKYSILNGRIVDRRKNNSIERDIYNNDGTIKGKQNYRAKEGNLLIVTEENLRLPFRYTPSDSGLEYVDYRMERNKRVFIYSVPKKYLYRLQQTVLVMSLNRRQAHLGGIRITLTNGHPMYLYVMSGVTLRMSEGVVPIASKAGVDYGKELGIIQKLWLDKGIIFNKSELNLTQPYQGEMNLGYKVFDPVTTYKGEDEFSIEERENMRKRGAY